MPWREQSREWEPRRTCKEGQATRRLDTGRMEGNFGHQTRPSDADRQVHAYVGTQERARPGELYRKAIVAETTDTHPTRDGRERIEEGIGVPRNTNNTCEEPGGEMRTR
ncbi:hypothetical protein R1flu_000295 [Riccia fluitans]|uniref:Uncharacterized protein n=1 Tax=Riccia fluitans TaxID=41844 RepID=A0ABD1Y0I9_9MARC